MAKVVISAGKLSSVVGQSVPAVVNQFVGRWSNFMVDELYWTHKYVLFCWRCDLVISRLQHPHEWLQVQSELGNK